MQASCTNGALSKLQSLLQIESRAATMMLVREGPDILELSPAFVMQRLVDLKVPISQLPCSKAPELSDVLSGPQGLDRNPPLWKP